MKSDSDTEIEDDQLTFTRIIWNHYVLVDDRMKKDE